MAQGTEASGREHRPMLPYRQPFQRRGLAIVLFVFGLATLLAGLGLLGMAVAMKGDSASTPKAINMEDYQKEKPSDKWLQIGACQLTSGFMYVRREGGPTGKIDCLLIPIWDSRQIERAGDEDQRRADIAAGRRVRPGSDGPGRKGLHTNLVLRIDDPAILEEAQKPQLPFNPMQMTESSLDKKLQANGYQGRAIEKLEARLDKEQLAPEERKSLITASKGLISEDFKIVRTGRPWTNTEVFGVLALGLILSATGAKWIKSSRTDF